MGTMQDTADKIRGNLIPQLSALRRVPMRYYQVLPLAVMKKLQCIVVGSAPGVLTVAITNRDNIIAIESLKEITGQSIFPVLIDPTKLRLLIQRIERREHRSNASPSRGGRSSGKLDYYQYAMFSIQFRSIMILLSSQKVKRS